MDPVTLKMAVQIVGTLVQSKTLRTFVVAFVAAVLMLGSIVMVTPILVAESLLGVPGPGSATAAHR